MKMTEPIRNPKHIAQLIAYFIWRGQYRNRLLIAICLYTALRIGDVLSLTWDMVYDFKKGKPRKSITLVEKKTGKSQTLVFNKSIITALLAYMRRTKKIKPRQALIINSRTGKAISRIQAYRIIRAAGKAVELQQRISCHSLRKTFGYHAWKSGVSPAIIMEIYNHSSLAVTRRYLGVTQDDKNAVYLGLKFA